MALNKNHQAHLDMMGAFESADKNTPRNALGNATYTMSPGTGMPRTPAQMASVKKAATKSAQARGQRAAAPAIARSPTAPTQPAPGVATGSIGIAKPKKGLLSL
jgi:hypothetical protein